MTRRASIEDVSVCAIVFLWPVALHADLCVCVCVCGLVCATWRVDNIKHCSNMLLVAVVVVAAAVFPLLCGGILLFTFGFISLLSCFVHCNFPLITLWPHLVWLVLVFLPSSCCSIIGIGSRLFNSCCHNEAIWPCCCCRCFYLFCYYSELCFLLHSSA